MTSLTNQVGEHRCVHRRRSDSRRVLRFVRGDFFRLDESKGFQEQLLHERNRRVKQTRSRDSHVTALPLSPLKAKLPSEAGGASPPRAMELVT